jgi:hypothetical protein
MKNNRLRYWSGNSIAWAVKRSCSVEGNGARGGIQKALQYFEKVELLARENLKYQQKYHHLMSTLRARCVASTADEAGRCCDTNRPGRYHLCQFAGWDRTLVYVSFRVNCVS